MSGAALCAFAEDFADLCNRYDVKPANVAVWLVLLTIASQDREPAARNRHGRAPQGRKSKSPSEKS